VRAALIVLAVLLCLGLLGLAWLVVVFPNASVPPRPQKTVALQLDEHSSLESVASQLSVAGLVEQPRVFALYGHAMRATQRLKRGRVLVTSQMTSRQLLQRIATGYGSTPVRITIPEGWNRFEIAARLAEWDVCDSAAFLAAAPSPALRELDARADSSEGYLFPDTYWLNDGMRAEQVVQRLTSQAKRRLQELQKSEAAAFESLSREFGFGLREVVVLASIVEKEARIPTEQPIIAGVFLNRLRDPRFRPKRLQADPTVAYGCLLQTSLPSCSGFDGKHITRTMTADPQNTYNTYRNDGLPPGPIANPGISALRAVLHPSAHEYYYFVARADGHHAFSADLASHNLAVQQAR
jgi:UPF0755 protein